MSVQDHHEETPVLPEQGGTLPGFSDESPSQQTADYPLSFESNRAYDTHPVESSRNKRTTAVLVGAGTLLAAGTALGIGYFLGNKGEDEVTASPKPTASQPVEKSQSPINPSIAPAESSSATPEISVPNPDDAIAPSKKLQKFYGYFDRPEVSLVDGAIAKNIAPGEQNEILAYLARNAFYPVTIAKDYNPQRYIEKGVPADNPAKETSILAYPLDTMIAGQIANDFFAAANLQSIQIINEMKGLETPEDPTQSVDYDEISAFISDLDNAYWMVNMRSVSFRYNDKQVRQATHGTESTIYAGDFNAIGVPRELRDEDKEDELAPRDYNDYLVGSMSQNFSFEFEVSNTDFKVINITLTSS